MIRTNDFRQRCVAAARAFGATLAILAAVGAMGCASTKGDRPAVSGEERFALRKEMAMSLAKHREWAAAVGPLLELAAEQPRDAEIQTVLGTVYREQGLFEQAEAAYDKALVLDPRNAGAYAGRGILRDVSGGIGDAALDDFRTAVRLAPDNGAYANNLGFALSVRRRYAEAEAALQEGLKHDPMSRRMRNNLGFVYGKLGHIDRAKLEFEHGGSTDEVENNLGIVYEQAGDSKEACTHYRAALVENPLLEAASENARRACSPDAPLAGRSP